MRFLREYSTCFKYQHWHIRKYLHNLQTMVIQKAGYRNFLLPKKWDSTPQNLTTPLLQQTAPLLFPTEEQPPLPTKSLQLWRAAVFVFWTEWHSILPSVVLGKYRQVLQVLAVQVVWVAKRCQSSNMAKNPRDMKLWWLSGRANRRPKELHFPFFFEECYQVWAGNRVDESDCN